MRDVCPSRSFEVRTRQLTRCTLCYDILPAYKSVICITKSHAVRFGTSGVRRSLQAHQRAYGAFGVKAVRVYSQPDIPPVGVCGLHALQNALKHQGVGVDASHRERYVHPSHVPWDEAFRKPELSKLQVNESHVESLLLSPTYRSCCHRRRTRRCARNPARRSGIYR